jgi:predicted enzyme related to lactoylglutathione lyase
VITRLDKVTVYVKSQEEAKKFWIDKVGFVLSFEQPMGPTMKWIEVSPKGQNMTSLVLYPKEAMQQQNPSMVAHPSVIFAANDIESTWKELKARGVDVAEIQSLPYGKMFNFKDNDGNPYLVRT